MTPHECIFCHRPVRYLRQGYCGACYARVQRNGTPEYEQINRRTGQKTCSYCGVETTKIVKGLCKTCYYRQKKNGILEYQAKRTLCSVDGCNDQVKTHGLCDKHWARVCKNGSTDDPFARGAKTAHPLYHSWSWIRREGKKAGGCDPRWDKFWHFVDDVGEAPSPLHRLYKKSYDLPYGPLNFVWNERVLDDIESLARAEYMKAWRRAYEMRNPRHFKNQYLRKYGITIEQFDAILAQQNGVCAICQGEEKSEHPTRGKFALAVDHDHKTKVVRSLLCSDCNRSIGLMREKPDLFRRAADYLEFHASQFACEAGDSTKP